jgi:cytochrome c oxidase subunit III
VSDTALVAHEHGDEVPYAHQFEDAEQQKEAVTLGMWAFLATEVLFFGALFCAYAVYRWKFYSAYAHGAEELDTTWGLINTLVLLVSSFTMALGVRCAQLGKKKLTTIYLILTIVFACCFLGIKYIEYSAKYEHKTMPGMADFGNGHIDDPVHKTMREKWMADGGEQLVDEVRIFFALYFCMTGLHGIHILIGVGLLAGIAFLNQRNWFGPNYYSPVEMVGLYWHFVDVVWVFLFPLLYLIPHASRGGH